MSATSLTVILDRAKAATNSSPLALFAMPGNLINCVFASTVASQRRIKKDKNFIATITRNDCPEYVRDLVRRAHAYV